MTSRLAFYTVGHSTRSLDEFGALLRSADVALVVDIRTVRRSRANPQYAQETLAGGLAEHGLDYTALTALGGLRSKSRDIPPEVNGYWDNASFHHYADYALSEPFHQGLAALVELGRSRRAAIMCAEAVWWRCHRRIVADYLLAGGESVFHLMGKDRVEAARLTEAAVIGKDQRITYPRRQTPLPLA